MIKLTKVDLLQFDLSKFRNCEKKNYKKNKFWYDVLHAWATLN